MILKQVFIINQDLKMGKGKIAVQVAHGEVFYMETVLTPGSDKEKEMTLRYSEWRLRDNQLMKKVVLKTTKNQIAEITGDLCIQKIWCSVVYDHGLTQVPENSLTCVVVEPLPEELCDKLFGHLKLL